VEAAVKWIVGRGLVDSILVGIIWNPAISLVLRIQASGEDCKPSGDNVSGLFGGFF